jgi:hypothetical protein
MDRDVDRDYIDIKTRGTTKRNAPRIMREYYLEDEPELFRMLDEMMKAGVMLNTSVKDDIDKLVRDLYSMWKSGSIQTQLPGAPVSTSSRPLV